MSISNTVRRDAADNAIFIRQRETRDAEALVHMFNQPRCRSGMVLDPFRSSAELEGWLQSNGSRNFEPVATVNDEAVALAGLFPCLDTQNHAAWMILFVHDDFQGRGIGTLMMSVLVTTAHILGLTRIQLAVICDNDRAISLYRKYGFEIEGRHEHYARRGSDFVNAFTMARITPQGTPRYLAMDKICQDLRCQDPHYQVVEPAVHFAGSSDCSDGAITFDVRA
jgi:L-phenylalanine/L-methionine N-acetyltransferase